jgi:hypothetical protein
VSRVRITESDVIAAVVPGKRAIINLTQAQRESLCAAPEGLKALALMEHLVYVRVKLGADGCMPLTERFLCRLAQRLDLGLGRNAVRRVRCVLAEAGVIARAGVYRQGYMSTGTPNGFRVPLWSVRPVCWIDGHVWRCAEPDRLRSATSPASVATRRSVKGGPWWRHPVFGNPDGRKPRGAPARDVKRWRSQDHLWEETRREVAWLRCARAPNEARL